MLKMRTMGYIAAPPRHQQWDPIEAASTICRLAETAAAPMPPGTLILKCGRMPAYIVIIRSGFVRLTAPTTDSGRGATIAVRGPGSILGASELFSRAPASLDASAVTPCTSTNIDVERFVELMDDQLFCTSLAALFARELHLDMWLLCRLRQGSVRTKLESLFEYCVHLGLGDPLTPFRHAPLLHRDIADILGCTPEHLSRVLTEMEREGIIRRRKGWIQYLRDEDRAT